jgi:hypothetical protein
MKRNKPRYISESDEAPKMTYSKDERNAFLESLRQFSAYKNEIYRSKKLKEIGDQIGQMIEGAEVFTLQETEDGWFDNITVNRDLKELRNDYKLFEKTCREITQMQQRLESLYENMGIKLGRYYDI